MVIAPSASADIIVVVRMGLSPFSIVPDPSRGRAAVTVEVGKPHARSEVVCRQRLTNRTRAPPPPWWDASAPIGGRFGATLRSATLQAAGTYGRYIDPMRQPPLPHMVTGPLQ
jgi:hypothetical protein